MKDSKKYLTDFFGKKIEEKKKDFNPGGQCVRSSAKKSASLPLFYLTKKKIVVLKSERGVLSADSVRDVVSMLIQLDSESDASAGDAHLSLRHYIAICADVFVGASVNVCLCRK